MHTRLPLLLLTLGATLPYAWGQAQPTAPSATQPAAVSPAGVPDPTNPASQTPAQQERGAQGKTATRHDNGDVKAADGILRTQDGTMYLKAGKLARVTYEMKLSEGLTVRPDGQITTRDGRTVALQEGQMMTLDGNVQQAPTGLGSTAPGSASNPNAAVGNRTDYGQGGIGGPGGVPRPENAPSK